MNSQDPEESNAGEDDAAQQNNFEAGTESPKVESGDESPPSNGIPQASHGAAEPSAPPENLSYWRTATKLVFKTSAFLGLNAAIYAAFFLLSLVWFAVWSGIAYLMAVMEIPVLAVVAVIIGLGAGSWVVSFLRRYILFMVKGGHIAVMTELLKNGSLPEGKSQVAYGKDRVQRLFVDINILFGLDQLIRATLSAMQRKIIGVTSWLPLPGDFRKVVKVLTEILKRSLTYVDESILSFAMHREEKNVWASARHGTLLYAQSYKPILKTAALVWLSGKALLFLVFVLFMVPGTIILLWFDHLFLQIIVVAIALSAAYVFEQIVFEPFALAYVLVTYYCSIAGKVPDPEWDSRIQSVSNAFKKLVGKAEEQSEGDAATREFEPTRPPHTDF